MIDMAHAATRALFAATSAAETRCVLAMATDLRSQRALQARARCVRRSLSVGDLHCAQEAGKEAVNVSCSIRDSSGLFELALEPGGFSHVNGEMPVANEHTVLETFLYMLAVAHAPLEPAYSE